MTSLLNKFEFIIASYSEAEKLLDQACRAGTPIEWVISINDPDMDPPHRLDNSPHVLKLSFHDLEYVREEGCSGDSRRYLHPPKPIHAKKIISFAQELIANGKEGERVLVHCHAGISRSSAAMYILMATLAGPGFERACLAQVCDIRRIACPNILLVEYGDIELGRSNKLFYTLSADPEGPAYAMRGYPRLLAELNQKDED